MMSLKIAAVHFGWLMAAGIVTCLFLFPARLDADALEFSVTTTDSGPPISTSVKGNQVIELSKRLIDREGEFAQFAGRPYAASVKFLGVKNAATFTSNASGNSVTLSFPKTGFSKTFTGSSSDDVRRQVEDFIKQNGDDAYGKFQKSINETSPLAPLSGNPQSGVGWLTAGSFSRFAFEPVVGPGAFELGGGGGLYFKADAAFIDSDHGSANTYDLAVALASRFSDRVALSLSTQFGFHDLQGSNTFLIGGDIGLPINVILPEQNQKTFGFRVSPFASGGAVVSVDLASLGLLGGGGVASALDIFLGDRIIVTVGDQIAYYAGVPVDYDDYSFDTDVDQLITRNGVKVTLPLGTGGFVDGGASYTSFLTGGAAVDGYVSPVAGIGLHFGKGNASVLRVGYSGDLGNGYVAHGGNLLLSFAW